MTLVSDTRRHDGAHRSGRGGSALLRERRKEFVDDRGTTFTMLWDESFESWIELGVSSQPTAILMTPDGTIITGWVGRFPEDQVLELAAQYTAG